MPALEAEAKKGFQPSSSSSMPTAASENRAAEGEADQPTDVGASSQFCDPLVSTLLVSPRLHPFNSAMFENLARNVDIALKQTPIMDRVEVEVGGMFLGVFFRLGLGLEGGDILLKTC